MEGSKRPFVGLQFSFLPKTDGPGWPLNWYTSFPTHFSKRMIFEAFGLVGKAVASCQDLQLGLV